MPSQTNVENNKPAGIRRYMWIFKKDTNGAWTTSRIDTKAWWAKHGREHAR